jgi:hypothetical protein
MPFPGETVPITGAAVYGRNRPNSEVHSFIKNGDPKVAVNIPIIRVVVKVQAGSSVQGYLPQQSS